MLRDEDEVEDEDSDTDAVELFKSDLDAYAGKLFKSDLDAYAGKLFKSDLDSHVLLSKPLRGEVHCVSWSGTKIACGDEAKFVTVLDVVSREVAWSTELGGKVRSVSWSADGTKIACGVWTESVTVPDVVTGTVMVLDAASGEVAWSKALDGEVYGVSWSADGTKIACGDGAKSVTVLDAARGEEAWSKALGGEVRSVSWSADGTKIACGDGAKFVTVAGRGEPRGGVVQGAWWRGAQRELVGVLHQDRVRR